MAKVKQKSRGARFTEALQRAVDALEEAISIQEEYSDWKDNVADNFQSGAMYEKLEAVCDIDLEGAKDTLEEAMGLDLPLGFGRD